MDIRPFPKTVMFSTLKRRVFIFFTFQRHLDSTLRLVFVFCIWHKGCATVSARIDFWNVSYFRQLLCPALIQLLGSPITDLTKRSKTITHFPEEINRGGRGTGNFAKSSSVVGPIPRTIYNIATELLRLVGPLAAMRPVLESLFHRIILYPPVQQRAEALKALKEVGWMSWLFTVA